DNYMLGDTTKISHLIFKAMMQTFGTDTSRFQQPSSVYTLNNELYITGVNPDVVPPAPPAAPPAAAPPAAAPPAAAPPGVQSPGQNNKKGNNKDKKDKDKGKKDRGKHG
ncbi:hypothetical protein, partial [Bacillus sp. OTU530]|uniref:hypothetical protein n=1 Tax=Bacillus sp. OTU530 TaxID=3043862 RepID=UPI00406C68F8